MVSRLDSPWVIPSEAEGSPLGHERLRSLDYARDDGEAEEKILSRVGNNAASVRPETSWGADTDRCLSLISRILLLNPQTLALLIKAVHPENNWPTSRMETFELAVKELAREPSIRHARSKMGRYGIDEILDAAGHLCLTMMLSNASGLSLSQPAASKRRPAIHDLFGHDSRYLAAAKKRLFVIDGNDHLFPTHRMVAEYLGARLVSQKLRLGELSLNRVIGLLTGPTGETTSDLRGLYAWLPCFCPEHADVLIPIDPLGIILHGDVSTLSLSLKKRLLFSLMELAKRDPWFRADNWSSEPFGALCNSGMTSTFRAIIDDDISDDNITSCVLDAIRYGDPVPTLGNALLRLIRKGGANGRQAVEAFARACPGRIADLKPVLNDIVRGVVDDPNSFLRPTLLRHLYPAHIPIK